MVAVVVLVRLAAVVERDRVRPHVLAPLALLLAVVLPVHAVPEEVDVDVVLEGGPGHRARLGGRARRSRWRARWDGRRCRSSTTRPARALLRRAREVERTAAPRTRCRWRPSSSGHPVLGHEDGQRACPGPGFEWTLSARRADASGTRTARARRACRGTCARRAALAAGTSIQASACRQALVAVVPARARAVERRRHDAVADAFARALRSPAARVKSEPSKRPRLARHRGLVVGVDELDAVAVREAVVDGVEVAAVVQLGLARLVVHHRVQAVRVGQREVEDAAARRAARIARPSAVTVTVPS